jgi:hypothetical protein
MYSVGDVVYVDFGDSISDGGEVISEVVRVTGDVLFLDSGHTVNVEDVPHIERMN